ncbi:hypothetical protein [Dysgonomonas sp. ZJ709]|uniref:hypothetical protein n=1 Tax=Dysgonomonas sp. ZJ709 TaxID=2709797 RepID=UPI0013ECFB0A|nr:hypothetical protein [Dysgonomonas sp. ZJ709]
METEINKQAFAFMSGRMTQTKALRALSKRCKYKDKVMSLYEAIESFELTREVTQDKIHSRKAESGYVEKVCIGDYVTDYIAEVEYYKYLQGGGQKYSAYLEEVRIIEKKNEEIRTRAYEEQQEAQARKDKEERIRQLKSVLELSEEQYIEFLTGNYKKELARLQTERKTKSVVEQIKWLEDFILSRIKLAIDIHFTTHRVYTLCGEEIIPKYNYGIGDEVVYMRDGKYLITRVEELRTNRDDSITYKLYKVDGIVNPYVGYSSLLPANEWADKLLKKE